MQVVISGIFRKHMNEIIELKQKLETLKLVWIICMMILK